MPTGIYKRTKPAWNKGKKLSPKHREGLSIASKKRERYSLSEETKQKIREARKLQIPPRPKGFKMSLEQRRKIGEANKGAKSPLWKGGLTIKNRRERVTIMNSLDYKEWRRGILKRDGYACVQCGQEENLEADHIQSFADHPELRFELSNGRTLCRSCHQKTDNYGWRYYHNKRKKELV